MEIQNDKDDTIYGEDKLETWVMDKCDEWRDHYDSNYREAFEEYYRLWRGIWSKSDSMRESERSRLVTPALQQAVESSVAEVEEATFGRGDWFEIRDDFQDEEKLDIEFTKKQLKEDMQYARARSSISEVLINAAVYGTGIGEIYLKEIKEYVPATQPSEDGGMQSVGVYEKERFLVKMRPVLPQNFLIDPLAPTIEDALGCATDMFVPYHQVKQDMEAGIYRKVEIATVESDSELEPDQELTYQNSDRVRLTKYYGLVPTDLFKSALALMDSDDMDENEQALEDLAIDKDAVDDGSYVEAIVIIANGDTLLKVEANPYMQNDRPIVAFQWDTVPSKFWGRGICEKGYNPQKALDTEMRARIDALALTIHPMMAIDATRMPRGAKPQIRAGQTILTNGNPSEILQPFNFGSLNQITFAQGQALQDMVQQATGAVDSAGMQNVMSGDAKVGAVSMSLGAIIKRHKRTLLNFQDNFLIPFVSKAACRYMQYNPELYKAQDHKYIVTGSLGIVAREYEVTQLVQLLQTMSPDSPAYPALLSSIVDQMNLSNREELLATLKQAGEPNPEAEAQKQAEQQLQMAIMEGTLQKLQAETMEIQSRYQQNQVETQLLPIEEETRRISALAQHSTVDEFEQLIKIAQIELQNKQLDLQRMDINSNERIASLQMNNRNDKQ
jgi:hypothetical protein